MGGRTFVCVFICVWKMEEVGERGVFCIVADKAMNDFTFGQNRAQFQIVGGSVLAVCVFGSKWIICELMGECVHLSMCVCLGENGNVCNNVRCALVTRRKSRPKLCSRTECPSGRRG